MAKRITIIDGHPDPSTDRLCHALADAFTQGARSAGHQVKRIDIARMDIPILRTQQEFDGETAPPDVQDAQEALNWAEHILIIYPLWLGTMPALLKAFFEQTFRPGFAFEKSDKGWPRKNLKGRSARIILTMGMPALVYRWFFLAHSLKSLERNILKFAGISPIRETIFGMVEMASDAKRIKWLKKMENLGRQAR